jgi:hypothetical protein
MTATTGDTIAEFVGPALGVKGARSLNDVLRARPDIRLDRRVAAKAATAPSSAAFPWSRGVLVARWRVHASPDHGGPLLWSYAAFKPLLTE